MAMLVLVSGSNNSGKSLFAEQLVAHTTGKRYYVATMIPCTDDNAQRIERHRKQRQNLGFQTLECPYQVGTAPLVENSVVLLEDVSNLLANTMFGTGNNADSVFLDICNLLNRCRMLVAVTISGLHADGYDAETASYINSLKEINRRLLERATVAITMQNRIPFYQKGGACDLI